MEILWKIIKYFDKEEKIKQLYFKNKEIILYFIFGGLTTLINLAVFWVFTDILLTKDSILNTVISISVAWLIAVIFAFITNKLYVFESKSRETAVIGKEFILFAICRLISYFFDLGFVILFANILGYNEILVKIISNVIVVVINYIASKLFIFKKDEK